MDVRMHLSRWKLTLNQRIRNYEAEHGGALQGAAFHGDRRAVEVLLERGEDVDDSAGRWFNPLQAAISSTTRINERIVQLLLNNGANVTNRRDTGGCTEMNALSLAICRKLVKGREPILQLLLNANTDVNQRGKNDETALHVAVRTALEETEGDCIAQLRIINILLDRGADTGAKNMCWETPLHLALGRGLRLSRSSSMIVQSLLNRGADANIGYGDEEHDESPLESVLNPKLSSAMVSTRQQCCMQKLWAQDDLDLRAQLADLLIKHGADLEVALQSAVRNTCLVSRSDYRFIDALLARGADINAQCGQFGSVLQAAAALPTDCSPYDIVKYLLSKGADPKIYNGKYGGALQAAAINGTVEVVRLLLDSDVDVNGFCDPTYGHALQAAVHDVPRNEVVELLLDYGASINATGGTFGSALHAAAVRGHEHVVELLISRGADVNLLAGEFDTVLQAAAVSGKAQVISLLLKHDVDVNFRGGKFGSALQAAAASGNSQSVELLLSRGADIDAQGGCYGSALHAAVCEGRFETVRLLLRRGTDTSLQAQSAGQQFLLHTAVSRGDTHILEELLRAAHPELLNRQDESDQTPLHIAVDRYDLQAARMLLAAGGSTDVEDVKKFSPFKLAVAKGYSNMVRLLYPWTKQASSITASQWRKCLQASEDCAIEMVTGEHPMIIEHELVEQELGRQSYPIKDVRKMARMTFEEDHFLNDLHSTKRVFLLADGAFLRWRGHPSWSYVEWWTMDTVQDTFSMNRVAERKGELARWKVQADMAPSLSAIQHARREQSFLRCGFYVSCPIVNKMRSLDEFQPLGCSEGTHGFQWIMIKPTDNQIISHAHQSLSSLEHRPLQSRLFFSTSDFAYIPTTTIDLFFPLVQQLGEIWSNNIKIFEARIAEMRTMMLKASGNDPALIQYFLKDTQLLEILQQSLREQISSLQRFSTEYRTECRIAHETEEKDIHATLNMFDAEIKKLEGRVKAELKNLLRASSQNIQLEFNLTSISEAQKSTSTSRSMKRLSWITFIFLPLLFIASLFGMNVNLLKNDPPWWLYFVFATPVATLVFIIWVVFKRSNALEEKLESRLSWLVKKKQHWKSRAVHDLEYGLGLARIPSDATKVPTLYRTNGHDDGFDDDDDRKSLRRWRTRTATFPVAGKKRT